MSEATQSQTLQQTLDKTDLGHVLYENRKTFFGVVIAILVGVTGFFAWKQAQKASALEHSVKVFEYQSGVWADVKAGKQQPAELVTAFEKLDDKVKSTPAMIPVALEVGKFLYEKGLYTEADAILSKVGANHPVSSFFVAMQRAVILEKLGKVDEAIKVLEPLAQGKEALMPAKISIDLGRLYLAKGDKARAQTQFDYVISSFPNDEQAKIAKLYLSQLATK